ILPNLSLHTTFSPLLTKIFPAARLQGALHQNPAKPQSPANHLSRKAKARRRPIIPGFMRSKLAVYSLVFMSGVCANAQPKPSATLIITNAAVYTVDKQHPRAEAVAVIGDRIVAVGSRAEI